MWYWLISLALFATVPDQSPADQQDVGLPAVRLLQPSGAADSTAQPYSPFYGLPICHEGKIFLRPIQLPRLPMASPVVRLDPNSSSAVVYDLNSARQFGRNSVAPAYTVDSFGRVYYLVRTDPGYPNRDRFLLLSFSSSGTLTSTIELAENLWPTALVVFPSGDFLVTGLDRAPWSGKAPPLPSAAILGSDGRLKRYLLKPKEEPSKRNVPAVQLVTGVMGTDGLVYVLVQAAEPRVEVWSESGERVRTFKLKTPLKDARAEALLVTDGAIAVQMHGAEGDKATKSEHPHGLIGVYDSATGEPRAFFDGRTIYGRPVCFDGNRLLFLVTKLDKFAVLSVPTE